MNWLRRIGTEPEPIVPTPAKPVREQVEKVAPGITALLDGLAEDRSHSVLDLGPAASSSLEVYARFARWIRFADLPVGGAGGAWLTALAEIPPHVERPYDLILAWNLLDRVAPEERSEMAARLAEIAAPDARMYVVIDTSGEASPRNFALVDAERMRYEPGATRTPWPALLPAEVERLLAPFVVTRAFTSKVGLREYVAVRKVR